MDEKPFSEKPQAQVYNYKYNIWQDFTHDPAQEWDEYIPQSPAAQNLYWILRKVVKRTPVHAAIEVLSVIHEQEET